MLTKPFFRMGLSTKSSFAVFSPMGGADVTAVLKTTLLGFLIPMRRVAGSQLTGLTKNLVIMSAAGTEVSQLRRSK